MATVRDGRGRDEWRVLAFHELSKRRGTLREKQLRLSNEVSGKHVSHACTRNAKTHPRIFRKRETNVPAKQHPTNQEHSPTRGIPGCWTVLLEWRCVPLQDSHGVPLKLDCIFWEICFRSFGGHSTGRYYKHHSDGKNKISLMKEILIINDIDRRHIRNNIEIKG